jgi:hypothetical protein
MASTSTVYVPIQSYVGFKRPDGASRGAYSAPRPVLQTIETLDGDTFPITGVTANSKMLYVPPLATFTYFPSTTSTAQVVTVINSGTQAVSLLGTTSTDYETSAIVDIGVLPASIPAGGSYTFNLSYYSDAVGEYAESLLLVSNADVPYYRIDTLQNVISAFNFRVSPTSATFTTTVLGLSSSTSIELIPIVNGVDNFDTVLDFSASIAGSPGWKYTTGTNSVDVIWDPDYVGNTNGTYTSTLAISVIGAGSTTINNTAHVNIDYSLYRPLSTWISPAAGNNSIIGISFDIFDDVKTVTIGVGAGGDGTPIYSEGGNIFAVMNNLKIGAGSIDIPYPYWSTVYSIPLRTPGTYISGEIGGDGLPLYLKKTTDGLNYADYFGFEQSIGSMFIVTYNGYDLVNIEINNLRELSGDADFDATMDNLTRAFHYYSEIDNPGRINNLPQYPFTTSTTYTLSNSTTPLPPGETRTRLFRGFVKTWRPFVNVTGTNVIGSGSGAAFDVTTIDPGYSVSLHPGSAGTGYNNNDTIKILGSSLGGTTPANDLVITVSASSGSVTGIVTATGFSASWIVDTSLVPLPT